MVATSAWKFALAEGFTPPPADPLHSAQARIIALAEAVERHVAASPHVRAFIESVPKGADCDCPDAPVDELLTLIAHRRGKVTFASGAQRGAFCEAFMVPVSRFRQDALRSADGFDAEHCAIADAAFACADAADGLWLAWYSEYAAPLEDATPEKRSAITAAAAPVLDQYDYSVLHPDGRREALRTAYPAEIALLVGALCDLADVCREEGRNAVAEYLDVLCAAYAETDPAALNGRWHAVDEAWCRIPPEEPFVPVHGMENYEHPFGVSPEFRLAWRTTSAHDARVIADVRTQALGFVRRAAHIREDARTRGISTIQRLDAGVFYNLADGGSGLLHRSAGQVVPNRPDVLAGGGKLFIADAALSAGFVELYREELRQHCRPDVASVLVPLVTREEMDLHTIGHEFFHPVGVSESVDAELGRDKDLLEEAKATIGGIRLCVAQMTTPESRRAAFAVSLARIFRFMHQSKLTDAPYAPYVRENLAVLDAMLTAKALRLTACGVDADLRDETVIAWLDALHAFLEELLAAYAAGDGAAIRDLRVRTCGAGDRGGTAAAEELLAWVNRATT